MECEEDAIGKMTLTASQRHKIRIRLRQTHDVRLYRRLLAVLEFDRGPTSDINLQMVSFDKSTPCSSRSFSQAKVGPKSA